MCGIAGYATRPGRRPAGRSALERMTARLEHRGLELLKGEPARPVGIEMRVDVVDAAEQVVLVVE